MRLRFNLLGLIQSVLRKILGVWWSCLTRRGAHTLGKIRFIFFFLTVGVVAVVKVIIVAFWVFLVVVTVKFKLSFDLIVVLVGDLSQLFLLILLLKIPEVFHLVFDAALGFVKTRLIFDFDWVNALAEEVPEALQLFYLFLHIVFVFLLHLDGVCIFKAALQLLEREDALKE